MPKSNPSENTREMYQALQQDSFEGIPVVTPKQNGQHDFSIDLKKFQVAVDKIRMMGDDFPYIRAALIDEAVAQGDIKYETKAYFADDATLTIDGEEHPIEDGSITMEQ